MLSSQSIAALRSLQVQATHPQDFVSGINLMHLVSAVFYTHNCPALTQKLRIGQHHKTGLNVLNVNIILNHLKKDPNISLPPHIHKLTAFTLIQEPQAMVLFIDWVLSQQPHPNHQQRLPNRQQQQPSQEGWRGESLQLNQMSPPREGDPDLQNLYFVSSLHKKEGAVVMDDSLEHQNPQQQVVRKGSFKMLKPKLSSAPKAQQSSEHKIQENILAPQSESCSSRGKEPLREMILIQSNTDEDDLQCRKTVPKMYERPPLYKPKHPDTQHPNYKDTQHPNYKDNQHSRHKDNQHSTHKDNQESRHKDNQHSRHKDNQESRYKDNQESRHKDNQQSRYKETQPRQPKESTPEVTSRVIEGEKIVSEKKGSSRKVFKVDLQELQESRKKVLLDWLISIHLLKAGSGRFLAQLHDICKDGVVFIEVVNYYRVRGDSLTYFEQPNRQAELHSNYSKLFSALGQQPHFESPLLNCFQYFLPQTQHKAFWSFLNSLYTCYHRQTHPRSSELVERNYQSVSRQAETSLDLKPSSYPSIRYNSRPRAKSKDTVKSRESHQSVKNSLGKEVGSNCSSVEGPRGETPVPSRMVSQKSEGSMGQWGMASVQKSIGGSVQKSLDQSATERGYRELYLCKFKGVQTPHKSKSFLHNSSFSRSRKGSSAKKAKAAVGPSVSLEMQMAVLGFIQQLGMEPQEELFKDPYRNGVLVCQAVKRVLGVDCLSKGKPSNIQDCRDNLVSAIEVIRSYRQSFPECYYALVEDMLRGDRPLLYGLLWQLIRPSPNQLQNESCFPREEEPLVGWVRRLEAACPQLGDYKIRSQAGLFEAILERDFLFQVAQVLTGKKAVSPIYEHPTNPVQKESNLKKALGYLVQSKIIRSDYLWKARSLVQGDRTLFRQLAMDLMSHHSQLQSKEQLRTVNFLKYLRPGGEGQPGVQKASEPLETTMTNQTMVPVVVQNVSAAPQLEVGWMRKLGFRGSLCLRDGVLLCRLVSQLTMKTVECKERPRSRAECLGNIRRAIKAIGKFRWDEYDILQADGQRSEQVYAYLREHYKHAYAFKCL